MDIHMPKKKKEKRIQTPTLFTKTNSKWIIGLNIKNKTVKILEYNFRENLDDFGYGDDFLHKIPKAPSVKELMNKLDFIKRKTSDL